MSAMEHLHARWPVETDDGSGAILDALEAALERAKQVDDKPTLIIFIDPQDPYPRSCYDQCLGLITALQTRKLPGAM